MSNTETSSYQDRNKAGSISIADIGSASLTEINKMVVSIRISYSMSMASELQFTVVDPDFAMLDKNYFLIGRSVIYTSQTLGTIDSFDYSKKNQRNTSNIDQLFEIARIDVSESPGSSPQIRITCYPQAIQQMKRDKKPSQITASGSNFVVQAAKKYGLQSAVQKTSKKQTINKASGTKQAESLWDVLSRLATDSKFVIFEVNGTLVFAAQEYILNKWGTSSEEVFEWDKKKKKAVPKIKKYVPLRYPSTSRYGTNGEVIAPDFEILNLPSLELSDNDPYEGRGSLNLARRNATQLRPGMTIDITGIPQFEGKYLIESVSFDDLSPDPVNITFRKPEKDPKKIKNLRIGVRTNQTNEFLGNDKTQTGPYGKLSNKSRKIIPDAARLLNLTTGTTEIDQKLPSKIYPLPSPSKQTLYPVVPKNLSAFVIEYGNTELWGRPIFKDESGIYPLDTRIVRVNSTETVISPAPTLPFTYSGNIDLFSRPGVENEGSLATVYSYIFYDSQIKKFVLLPQVIWINGEGALVSADKAAAHYYKYGEYLGKFNTAAEANNMADLIGDQQQEYYGMTIGTYSATVASSGKYILLPGIYLDESSQVKRQTTDETAFSLYQENEKHLGKFKTPSLASSYKEFLDIQQIQILKDRFPPPFLDFPESSLYPLPSAGEQLNYPFMGSGLITEGNINLYTVITKESVRAGKTYLDLLNPVVKYPVTEEGVNGGNPFALVLSTIWNVEGLNTSLNTEKAYRKYLADGLFLAKCESVFDANLYARLILHQQLITFNERFPELSINVS